MSSSRAPLLATAAAAAAAAAAYVLWRRARGPIGLHALRAKLATAFAATDSDGRAWLEVLSSAAALPLDSSGFADALDASEPLRGFRARFHIPPHGVGGQQAYMAGNSLGLMPRDAPTAVQREMDKWASRGVSGHFEGALPWAKCEDALPPLLAELVGAKDATLEVAAMNSLTVNLHLLMAAFYKPTAGRAHIIIEADAFPSDRYAVASQIRHHGLDPDTWLVEVQPRRADGLLHTADILAAIEKHEGTLALVLLGGVNYLSGQVLEMATIARHMCELNARRAAAGAPPIPFGLDLAHAVGNVPLQLHDWGVDFAAWCSYKYLNSGAGCLSALFVHEKHAHDDAVYPRLAGWWGVPLATRFVMAHAFEAAAGASAFGVSNVNPLLVACVHASLSLFRDAGGIAKLRRKSLLLTAYLEALLRSRGLLLSGPAASGAAKADAASGASGASGTSGASGASGGKNGSSSSSSSSSPPGGSGGARRGRPKATLRLLTPAEPSRRGCQLSLRVIPSAAASGPPLTMRALEKAMHAKGVVGDSREPDVMRLAPVPLYNSFGDVRKVVDALEACLA